MKFTDLITAAEVGGAVALSRRDVLEPAGGWDELVEATKYPGRGNEGSVNEYVKRNVGDKVAMTVTLSSKQDHLNRMEVATLTAPQESPLSQVPRMRLHYLQTDEAPEVIEYDLTLSHRAFDAHLMVGSTVDGVPITETEQYLALRDTTAVDAWAMLHTSPVSLLYGCWDSARKVSQTRIASTVTGKMYGVLADQDGLGWKNPARKYATKIDPVGASFKDLAGPHIKTLMELRRGSALVGKAPAAGEGSKAGVGNIISTPFPTKGNSPSAVAGVAVSEVVRSTLISLSTLRVLNFGDHYRSGISRAEGDTVARALLVATALAMRAYADVDGFLRAGCVLNPLGESEWELVGANGVRTGLGSIDIATAETLLAEGLEHAARVGISWSGQVFEVIGDPAIRAAAVATDDDES